MEAAPYVASPWGQRFHKLVQNEALGAGSAGPGKTTTLVADPFPQIRIEHDRCVVGESGDDSSPLYPFKLEWGESVGWALHLRRTLKQLVQSIQRAKKMFPQIDPNVKWNEAATTFTFASGFHYQFGHCKDPDDWLNYFSLEFTHIGFDELIQFEEEQYHMIRSRLRTSDPVLRTMLKCRAMTNPMIQMDDRDNFTVSNPMWVRDRFVEPAKNGNVEIEEVIRDEQGQTYSSTRIYLPATLDDNPNKQFAADYRATLMSLPEHAQEALLKGNWYYVPGAFFGKEWNESIHTEQPFKIPAHWSAFRSMDWGYKNPGCILWGVLDEDDNLGVVRELIFREKTVPQVCQMIREIETDMGWWDIRKNRSRLTGPADPQIWEERGDVGETKAQTFVNLGIPWVPGDRGARRGSAQKLLTRLADHGHGKTVPGIFFFKNCVQCIKTIPSIPSDPDDAELPMDGGYDHPCDATRYMVSYVSRGRRGIAKVKALSEPWEDDEEKAPKQRAGYHGGYGDN